MASITTRSGKGSPLTNAEVDANFTNLNSELGGKLVAASNLSDLASASSARSNLGLGSVENKSSATIRGELTSSNVTTALGFTPANSASLATVATSGAYSDLTGAPTALSAFTNDSSYLTSSSAASTYLTITDAASTYQTQSGMSSYLTTSSASSTYLAKAGGTLTGGVTISMSVPRFNLTETDGTSTHAQTVLIRDADVTSFQTRDSSGTFVSNDWILTHGASGVSNYEWRVNNVGKLFLNSAGSLGLGTNSLTGITMAVASALTGATTAQQLRVGYTIQSDVTATAYSVRSQTGTAAASFTLNALAHFTADQGTIGAGSTVTNQYGFYANSTLTGAGSNYGFYGNIASGSGRYNLYMNGTADNYFGGAVLGSDSALTRMMLKDTGFHYYDSTTTAALDYTNGSHQRWAPTAASSPTLSVSNWPPSGNLGELLIEAVNLGAAGTITWPTVNWVKSDGSTTTTFSSNGVTLQSSGTDFIVLWTRDAGTTIYGKIVR